jgi:hypothetical protein
MIWTMTDETSAGRPGIAFSIVKRRAASVPILFISHEVFGDSPCIVADPKLLNLPYVAPRFLTLLHLQVPWATEFLPLRSHETMLWH